MAATIHQKLSALSAFYTHLCENSFRAENPVESVKRPAVNPYGKATFLNLEEQRHLLAQVKRDTEQGVRDYALLLFLTTAVRVGVVCNAYVRDLEWRGSELHLNYLNKGGKPDSARVTGIASALDAYLESRGASLEEPLFVATANGRARARDLHGSYELQPLDPSTVRGLVATYAKRARLENITPHSLRRSAKGTIMEVSKLLLKFASCCRPMVRSTAVTTRRPRVSTAPTSKRRAFSHVRCRQK